MTNKTSPNGLCLKENGGNNNTKKQNVTVKKKVSFVLWNVEAHKNERGKDYGDKRMYPITQK